MGAADLTTGTLHVGVWKHRFILHVIKVSQRKIRLCLIKTDVGGAQEKPNLSLNYSALFCNGYIIKLLLRRHPHT